MTHGLNHLMRDIHTGIEIMDQENRDGFTASELMVILADLSPRGYHTRSLRGLSGVLKAHRLVLKIHHNGEKRNRQVIWRRI